MLKLVWDTSAIINIKEPNAQGYSPAHSLHKDLNDGWIDTPYMNIFPALAIFEVAATVSRKHRDGHKMLREFYLLDENSLIYDVNADLVEKSYQLFTEQEFSQLRGADLVFACIAAVEDAWLITMDKAFKQHVGSRIHVLDLNASRDEAKYRDDIKTYLSQP